MAEPKKKLSKSRTRRRRHQIKIDVPNFIYCPKCHEAVLRHNVCKNCGEYRGKKVLTLSDEKPVAELADNKSE